MRDLSLALEGATVTLSAAVFPAFTVSLVLLIVSLVTGCFTVILQVALTPLPSLAVAVIVAVPFARPLTTPFAVTVATFLLLVVHLTDLSFAVDGAAVALRDVVYDFLIQPCLKIFKISGWKKGEKMFLSFWLRW